VAQFFIETSTGQVATGRQLSEAGMLPPSGVPPRPWLRVQGTGDASTMWYAVLRKQIREGVFIGTLVLRHTDHHASLLQQDWQEVPVSDISAPA
jgi:hypothetical protein